jgi:uncharacterized membrane protein YecN with MAPEG domain
MILPITLTIAAAATLTNVWLALRAGRVRPPTVEGGLDPKITARLRAQANRTQANFVAYTPFFLILLGLIELAEGSALWLWGVSIAYIGARLVHVFGMDRPGPNRLRATGQWLTFAILVGLAGYALVIPYLAGPLLPLVSS